MSKYNGPYIGIIDLGTGSIRLTVFDHAGHILEERQVENRCIYPEPGYVEQDTQHWWNDLAEMFMDLPETTRDQITVISVTGQREGIVPVNERFEPISNLITWLDSRTSEQADYILNELGEEFIYRETGLVHNPAWSLSKILWIKEKQPQIYDASYKLLQAVDYLQSRLSGKACTDVSMASRTCMLNVVQRSWSAEILSRFGIARNKLPDLLEPGELIGEISSLAAGQFGLPGRVKILAGAGDQQAAAIGAGAFNEGIVSIGIGTSSALSITIEKPVHIKEGSIILNCAAVPGKWEYEPPIWNTGSLIKWYHEQLDESSSSYEELLKEAHKIAPGSDGLLAIPYFSGAGSPRWDTDLSGGFYGLSLTHGRVHFLRALMEAIAFEIRYNIELIEKSGVQIHRVILSGGASQNTVLCGIVSNVLQKPVQIFTEKEASTWGLYTLIRSKIDNSLSLESLHKTLNLPFRDLTPDPGLKDTYDVHYKRYLELGNALSKLKF
jgi:sugar (pentulose or hexulose) kinase